MSDHRGRLSVVLLLLWSCGGSETITTPTASTPTASTIAYIEVGLPADTIFAVNVQHPVSAIVSDQRGYTIEGVVVQWSTSAAGIVTVDDQTGVLTTVAEGTAVLTATADGVTGSAPISVVVVQQTPAPADLATPAPGHLWEIPVLVIRYLPTANGIDIDVTKTPAFWTLDEKPLTEIRDDIDAFTASVKFMLEEGSRFRGYGDQGTPPSLGYVVVDIITVYDAPPPGKVIRTTPGGHPVWDTDWFAVFDRFDVAQYVNQLGVKEIWFWYGGLDDGYPSYDPNIHDPADFRGFTESNMSSPTTGDISNSNRDNSDLPVYDHTYIVYGYNFRRTQAEAVHNHGHQLESQFSHVGGREFFWGSFVGWNLASGSFTQGRAGATHFPPNATADYDYNNLFLVESDIEDWRPDNGGQKKLVNRDTWGDIGYAWPRGPGAVPQRVESQWYIYWMQNMPGRGNEIPFGTATMTNWWSFIGDWDAAIQSGQELYQGDVGASYTATIRNDLPYDG